MQTLLGKEKLLKKSPMQNMIDRQKKRDNMMNPFNLPDNLAGNLAGKMDLLPSSAIQNLGFQINPAPIKKTKIELSGLRKEGELAPKWMHGMAKEAHKLLDPNLLAYGKAMSKDPAIQSMLQQSKDQHRKDLLARFSTPEYLQKITEANRINKLITPAYIESAKTALGAFDKSLALSHRDMLSRVSQYTDLTDQILNTGINAQIAWDMLEPFKIVTEDLQFHLRSYEPEESEETTEQLKEIIENKDEQLDFKEKEIAELKALLATSEKQEKRIEKQTRVNQLHTLIRKVDVALTNDGIPPTAQAVWNEIEKNHDDVYDDETIIQEVKENTIFWKSKGGKEQSLSITSFTATLSAIRKKY